MMDGMRTAVERSAWRAGGSLADRIIETETFAIHLKSRAPLSIPWPAGSALAFLSVLCVLRMFDTEYKVRT